MVCSAVERNAHPYIDMFCFLQALLRGDPQPAGERKKSPVYKAKGASGDDDFFTELRAQLIHNDDRGTQTC